MSGAARAFWVIGPGRGEMRDETLAPAKTGEVLVRALFSGISRGTEALVFAARVPASQYAVMRAPFQVGEFPAPVKYGYACVGIVEDGERTGQVVFCLHPHQDRFVVPADAAHPLPDDLPPQRAVLAANMETALNGLWDADAPTGTRLAVIGAGTVGCLVAYLAERQHDGPVELIDIDPGKAAVAEALGVAFATPDAAAADCGTVIHASGNPAGLVAALGLAAFEGTIVEMSWYGDTAVALPLGEAFHSRRLTIKSSQVGAVAPLRRAQWSHGRRLGEALSLLRDDALDVLISGESSFDNLPETMAQLAAATEGVLCHRIRYAPQ
jgi:NADPH:quinone reductase-like Zn-dependent oxidoreductase